MPIFGFMLTSQAVKTEFGIRPFATSDRALFRRDELWAGLCAEERTEGPGGTSYRKESSIRHREVLFYMLPCGGPGGIQKPGTAIPLEVAETVTIDMETRLLSGTKHNPPVLAAILCVGLFSISGGVSAGQGSLDGKVFIVENGSKGEKADGRDVYLFRNGTFHSTIREKRDGFREGAYTSRTSEDTITFVADTKSGSRGTIHWEGTVRGGEIDIRYTWTDVPRWYDPNPKREFWARGREVNNEVNNHAGASFRGTGTSGLLDGRTFFVRAGEKGKPVDHDDYMIFREGVFVSSGCVEYNFGTSSYSAASEGNGIRFRAEMTSPAFGTMYWDGIVRGDVMEATSRWVDDRWYWKVDRQYWYRGGPAE
jgi:hypothetical protein